MTRYFKTLVCLDWTEIINFLFTCLMYKNGNIKQANLETKLITHCRVKYLQNEDTCNKKSLQFNEKLIKHSCTRHL